MAWSACGALGAEGGVEGGQEPGPLAFLPLHAAGRHTAESPAVPRTVLDRAVSSYLPALRMLRGAADSDPSTAFATTRGLVVSMPRTPGHGDLPGAAAEAAALVELFPGRVITLSGASATRAAVLEALPDCEWAHFACHGQVDYSSPVASSLVLHDHDTVPLTVSDLARLESVRWELAFLSACSTAQTSMPLADEVIYPAAALMAVGFPQVVATLWPVPDRIGRRVAAELYRGIAAAGSAEHTAVVLHRAQRRLRDRRPERPSRWAAHAHYG